MNITVNSIESTSIAADRINPNIAHRHSIARNAADTMAAERIRTWVDDGKGIAPDAETTVKCSRKGGTKAYTSVFADGSKIIVRYENCQPVDITAKR